MPIRSAIKLQSGKKEALVLWPVVTSDSLSSPQFDEVSLKAHFKIEYVCVRVRMWWLWRLGMRSHRPSSHIMEDYHYSSSLLSPSASFCIHNTASLTILSLHTSPMCCFIFTPHWCSTSKNDVVHKIRYIAVWLKGQTFRLWVLVLKLFI